MDKSHITEVKTEKKINKRSKRRKNICSKVFIITN